MAGGEGGARGPGAVHRGRPPAAGQAGGSGAFPVEERAAAGPDDVKPSGPAFGVTREGGGCDVLRAAARLRDAHAARRRGDPPPAGDAGPFGPGKHAGVHAGEPGGAEGGAPAAPSEGEDQSRADALTMSA